MSSCLLTHLHRTFGAKLKYSWSIFFAPGTHVRLIEVMDICIASLKEDKIYLADTALRSEVPRGFAIGRWREGAITGPWTVIRSALEKFYDWGVDEIPDFGDGQVLIHETKKLNGTNAQLSFVPNLLPEPWGLDVAVIGSKHVSSLLDAGRSGEALICPLVMTLVPREVQGMTQGKLPRDLDAAMMVTTRDEVHSYLDSHSQILPPSRAQSGEVSRPLRHRFVKSLGELLRMSRIFDKEGEWRVRFTGDRGVTLIGEAQIGDRQPLVEGPDSIIWFMRRSFDPFSITDRGRYEFIEDPRYFHTRCQVQEGSRSVVGSAAIVALEEIADRWLRATTEEGEGVVVHVVRNSTFLSTFKMKSAAYRRLRLIREKSKRLPSMFADAHRQAMSLERTVAKSLSSFQALCANFRMEEGQSFRDDIDRFRFFSRVVALSSIGENKNCHELPVTFDDLYKFVDERFIDFIKWLDKARTCSSWKDLVAIDLDASVAKKFDTSTSSAGVLQPVVVMFLGVPLTGKSSIIGNIMNKLSAECVGDAQHSEIIRWPESSGEHDSAGICIATDRHEGKTGMSLLYKKNIGSLADKLRGGTYRRLLVVIDKNQQYNDLSNQNRQLHFVFRSLGVKLSRSNVEIAEPSYFVVNCLPQQIFEDASHHNLLFELLRRLIHRRSHPTLEVKRLKGVELEELLNQNPNAFSPLWILLMFWKNCRESFLNPNSRNKKVHEIFFDLTNVMYEDWRDKLPPLSDMERNVLQSCIEKAEWRSKDITPNLVKLAEHLIARGTSNPLPNNTEAAADAIVHAINREFPVEGHIGFRTARPVPPLMNFVRRSSGSLPPALKQAPLYCGLFGGDRSLTTTLRNTARAAFNDVGIVVGDDKLKLSNDKPHITLAYFGRNGQAEWLSWVPIWQSFRRLLGGGTVTVRVIAVIVIPVEQFYVSLVELSGLRKFVAVKPDNRDALTAEEVPFMKSEEQFIPHITLQTSENINAVKSESILLQMSREFGAVNPPPGAIKQFKWGDKSCAAWFLPQPVVIELEPQDFMRKS